MNKKMEKEDMHDYISLSKWPSIVGLSYISLAKPMRTGHASREMASYVPPYVLISGAVVKRPRAWQAWWPRTSGVRLTTASTSACNKRD